MRWSVSVVAEGDRVLDPRGDRRAGRRGRGEQRDRLGHRHDELRRPAGRRGGRRRRGRRARGGRVRRGRRTCRLPPWPVTRVETISEDDDLDDGAVIRLGSLAGYPFEGPRVLAGWTPPERRGGLRHPLQARAGHQARPVRRHLRRPLRRPVDRALPVPPPAGVVLDPPGRRPLEAVHLHLRGARRAALAPRADRPRAHGDLPPGLQPGAVRPGVEGRVDRRVHRADHRPPHHRSRPGAPGAETPS